MIGNDIACVVNEGSNTPHTVIIFGIVVVAACIVKCEPDDYGKSICKGFSLLLGKNVPNGLIVIGFAIEQRVHQPVDRLCLFKLASLVPIVDQLIVQIQNVRYVFYDRGKYRYHSVDRRNAEARHFSERFKQARIPLVDGGMIILEDTCVGHDRTNEVVHLIIGKLTHKDRNERCRCLFNTHIAVSEVAIRKICAVSALIISRYRRKRLKLGVFLACGCRIEHRNGFIGILGINGGLGRKHKAVSNHHFKEPRQERGNISAFGIGIVPNLIALIDHISREDRKVSEYNVYVRYLPAVVKLIVRVDRIELSDHLHSLLIVLTSGFMTDRVSVLTVASNQVIHSVTHKAHLGGSD